MEAVAGDAKQEGETRSAMSGTRQAVWLPSDAFVQVMPAWATCQILA